MLLQIDFKCTKTIAWFVKVIRRNSDRMTSNLTSVLYRRSKFCKILYSLITWPVYIDYLNHWDYGPNTSSLISMLRYEIRRNRYTKTVTIHKVCEEHWDFWEHFAKKGYLLQILPWPIFTHNADAPYTSYKCCTA